MAAPAAPGSMVVSTLLIITEGAVVLVGAWSAALGIIAFRNARRNQGRRMPHAVGAIVVAVAAIMVATMLLTVQASGWWAVSGLAG